PISAYNASPPVIDKNTAPMMASANPGRCVSRLTPYTGLHASNICGARPIARAPVIARTRNQTIMTGPNRLATLAVPRLWKKKSTNNTAMVTGITYCAKPGLTSSRPSTALNTETAGVIRASQKKNAVPASANATTVVTHGPPPTNLRLARANSARIPPSPSLSARMMMVTYFNVTEMASAQKMSEHTPITASLSNGPALASDCSSAYSGLVPISPYTIPVALTTVATPQRCELLLMVGPAARSSATPLFLLGYLGAGFAGLAGCAGRGAPTRRR